jgi:Cft2 family RNA processing exonuclease
MHYLALGGGNEVGASCNYLEIGGARVLVDAGIRVGAREMGVQVDALPDLALLQDLGGVDAVLVTHAHLDHIGALPLVHQAYPAAPIFATAPTVHLMRVLLADTLKIMSIKAEQEMECPLYGADLVSRMFTRVVSVSPGMAVQAADGLQAYFFPAGHILGASMVGLECDGERALFTGDVSMDGQRTIPGLVMPDFRPHLLVMESTYGNRLHANRQREEKGLAGAVAEVVAAGGHALIPAFALGRAQEVVLLLQAYQQAGRIPGFPIWVDGMVRSVCNTYVNFPEYLKGPVKRAINNGGNPFYREKTNSCAVTSPAQREKILAGAPSCIVSSSGMLTGGPSQFYASRLAGDEKNAILLCGYQDEESPGHKLLDLAGGAGRELTLDGRAIPVKCRVDKYGLSAHADAGELAVLAERLKPRRVVLVHGDNGAREALAALLAGKHPVHMPENAEELHFAFRLPGEAAQRAGKERDAAVLSGIGRGREIIPQELWEYLNRQKTRGGQLYTVEELAVLWYGPGVSPEQQELAAGRIEGGSGYFARDWKHPFFYRLRRPDQVALDRRREQVMAALEKLPGHLVLLKDANGAVRAGICFSVNEHGFEVWQVGRGGASHPAENLLEVVDRWLFQRSDPAPGEEKTLLHRLLTQARPLFKSMRPGEIRHCFMDEQAAGLSLAQIINMLNLPDNTASRLALAWRLNTHPEIFRRGAEDPWLVTYRLSSEDAVAARGQDAGEPELVECMEQNAALALLDQMFPPGSGLYRKGIDRAEGRLALYFEFPQAAAEKYREQLKLFSAETGWEVVLHPEAHHGALSDLARQFIPREWMLLKNPSIHREARQVAIKCRVPAGGDRSEFAEAAGLYSKLTGFELILTGENMNAGSPVELDLQAGNQKAAAERMEINMAYAAIRERLLDAGAVVYKTGKKTSSGGEYLEISFISPQVGRRYAEIIQALAAETGWPLAVNPEPNQNEIKALVRANMKLEWGMKKEPGFFKDRGEVLVKLVNPPDDDSTVKSELVEKIELQTGYRLVMVKS